MRGRGDRSEEVFDRLKRQFPDEHEALIEALARPASPSIRWHPTKGLSAYQEVSSPITWEALGRRLDHRPTYALDPAYHAGAYYPQEASSMRIITIIQALPHPVKYALDLCAAPGGKSTHLLSLTTPDSTVVCNEPFGQRYAVLKENLTRWGIPRYITTRSQAHRLQKAGSIFDLILIDAPCSGEGLLRKGLDPDRDHGWTAEQCCHTQHRLLEQAHHLLRPGGTIIYCTCTMNPDENERQIASFAATHGYHQEGLNDIKTHGAIKRAHEGYIGYYALPHLSIGEPFFYTALHKPGQEVYTPLRLKNKTRDKWKVMREVDHSLALFHQQDRLQLSTVATMELHQHLTALGIHAEMPDVATYKGRDFIPTHFTAMAAPDLFDHASVTLDRDQALAYLRHQPVEGASWIQGWQSIYHEGRCLGYAKYDGRRMINKYPMKWRLRR